MCPDRSPVVEYRYAVFLNKRAPEPRPMFFEYIERLSEDHRPPHPEEQKAPSRGGTLSKISPYRKFFIYNLIK